MRKLAVFVVVLVAVLGAFACEFSSVTTTIVAVDSAVVDTLRR